MTQDSPLKSDVDMKAIWENDDLRREKMDDQDEFTAKPSRWRYFWAYFCLDFGVYLLGTSLRQLFNLVTSAPLRSLAGWLDSVLWVGLATLFVTWLLTIIGIEHSRITIAKGVVEGPSVRNPTWTHDRVCFPIARLDRARSKASSIFERILRYRYIQSLDGDRIRLDEFAFEGAQIRMILSKLGCS